MPRKPNYKFERMERDRAKALKKAERLKLKQERAEQKKTEDGDSTPVNQAIAEEAPTEVAGAEE